MAATSVRRAKSELALSRAQTADFYPQKVPHFAQCTFWGPRRDLPPLLPSALAYVARMSPEKYQALYQEGVRRELLNSFNLLTKT